MCVDLHRTRGGYPNVTDFSRLFVLVCVRLCVSWASFIFLCVFTIIKPLYYCRCCCCWCISITFHFEIIIEPLVWAWPPPREREEETLFVFKRLLDDGPFLPLNVPYYFQVFTILFVQLMAKCSLTLVEKIIDDWLTVFLVAEIRVIIVNLDFYLEIQISNFERRRNGIRCIDNFVVAWPPAADVGPPRGWNPLRFRH